MMFLYLPARARYVQIQEEGMHTHPTVEEHPVVQPNATNVTVVIDTPPSIIRLLNATAATAQRVRRKTNAAQVWNNQDQPLFKGWDCREPQAIKKIAFNTEDNCHADSSVKAIKNVSVTLLQKSDIRKHKGIRCAMVETRQVFDCGMFDHNAVWTTKSYFELPRELSRKECHELRASGQFTDDLGVIRQVKTSGKTILNYDLAGRTWNNGAQLKCEGQDFILDGQTIRGAIIHIQQTFEVGQENIINEKGILRADKENMYLPCSESERACILQDATFLWTIEAETECPFKKTRDFSGTWATDEEGNHVVMSSDGSLIRLIAEEEEIHCGQRIHSTNYKNLYIALHSQTTRKWSTLDPNEVNIQTYVANRDDFVYHLVTKRLQQEFQAVMKNTCKEFKDAEKFKFMAFQKNPGLASWYMQEGTFASVGGETMFVYECKEILATPRRTESCYQALPVAVVAPEEFKKTNNTWFLEPNTRRLTVEGVPIPCSQILAPNMKTTTGRWISYGSQIQYVEPPSFHQKNYNWTVINLKDAKLDWPKGGVYNYETITQFFMDIHRRKEHIEYTMARQTRPGRYGNRLTMKEMFPTEDLYKEMKEEFLGAFLSTIREAGGWCSIIVVTYMVYQLVSQCIKSVQDGAVALMIYGWSKNLFTFFCMRFLVMYEFQNTRKERHQKAREEQQLQADEAEENDATPPPYPEDQGQHEMIPLQRHSLPTGSQ